MPKKLYFQPFFFNSKHLENTLHTSLNPLLPQITFKIAKTAKTTKINPPKKNNRCFNTYLSSQVMEREKNTYAKLPSLIGTC